MEGAMVPSVVKTEKKYMKEILLTGTFGIRFEPFLQNAEPYEEAKTVVIESIDNKYPIPIERQKNLFLAFQVLENHLKKTVLSMYTLVMVVTNKIQLKMLEISDRIAII